MGHVYTFRLFLFLVIVVVAAIAHGPHRHPSSAPTPTATNSASVSPKADDARSPYADDARSDAANERRRLERRDGCPNGCSGKLAEQATSPPHRGLDRGCCGDTDGTDADEEDGAGERACGTRHWGRVTDTGAVRERDGAGESAPPPIQAACARPTRRGRLAALAPCQGTS